MAKKSKKIVELEPEVTVEQEKKLGSTTILIQVYKELTPTLHDALRLTDPKNIIIYSDGSTFDFSHLHEDIRVIKSATYDGSYEVCLNSCIDSVTTKYLMKVNGGDEIYDAEEPKEGFQIFLARYASPIPSHEMRKNYYKTSGTSFISGSVFETEIYKTLLNDYTPEMKTKWVKFGKFCGDTVLNSEWKYYLSEKVSFNFTYKMWGGMKEAFKVGKDRKHRRKLD